MEKDLSDGNGILNISTNDGYTDASALQIRLNATPLVRKIREYLSGVQEIPNSEGGLAMVKIGEPLCSAEGVRQVVSFVELNCNPQVFQANIDAFQYGDILCSARIVLSKYLIGAAPRIGMDPHNRGMITGSIMGFIQLELSGVIGGFRTTSLTPTIRTVESNTINQPSRRLFGGNK